MKVLESGREAEEESQRRRIMMEEWPKIAALLTLEMKKGTRNQELKVASRHQARQRDTFSSRDSRKEHSFTNTWIFSPVRPTEL